MIRRIITLLESSCWNIGFATISAEQLLRNPHLLSHRIQWLKHPYKIVFLQILFF